MAEVATSFVVAALFLLSCRHFYADMNDRLGQVSGLAAIEWRFALFALPILGALLIAARGKHFEVVTRFACAALAGLATATIAGGIIIILHKTKFGLGAIFGDVGILSTWADDLTAGKGLDSPVYPPLQIYLLAWMSKLSGLRSEYAMQAFQILGVAVMGPLAYSAWRLVMKPGAALLVGVVATIPMVEAYRQYPLLVLVVMIPVLIKFLQVLRDCADDSIGKTIRNGAVFGLGLGILFLFYSGWFQWSGPGFIVAAAIVFPWRTSWKTGALLCGVAGIVFALLSYRYVMGVTHGTGVVDTYVYFDATIEPSYVAMWRGGLPGNIGVWPPVGELGGVGVFTLALCIGLGIALVLGRGRTLVIGVACMLAGTWMFRMWHAQHMWKTKLVQLWPRTTAELCYLLVILLGYSVYLVIDKLRRSETSVFRTPSAMIGGIAGATLLIASASSATVDRYMPRDGWADPGHLASLALNRPNLEDNQVAAGTTVAASSALETKYWSVGGAIDHVLWRGYSSELGHKEDHEEWVDINFHETRRFSRVQIWPALDGAPIEIEVDIWDGKAFVPVASVKDFPARPMWPQMIKLSDRWETDLIRVRAKKLRKVGDDYVFRAAEIGVFE